MKQFLTLLFLAVTTPALAQGPNDTGIYYQNANGKSGKALKTAFYNIIKSHKAIGYDGLYEGYKKTDTRADGYVRDWYSNATNYTHVTDKAGSYREEGDCYNREHCVPQSWYKGGGNDGTLKCDIVHVLPTDGYVNNRRSNNLLAETKNPSWQSKNGYSRVGTCSVSGYSGTIFEPNDEIKGDIARIYFYMVTCYEENVSKWANNATANAIFDGTSYPALKSWYLQMLMQWAEQDPVDDIERARNEAVYEVQQNRNPFVDYPGLEDYIWGDKKNESFDYTNFNGTATTVRTPYFTPGGGTYNTAQQVTIGCSTAGATIYYTTNGATPSASSTRYSGAITISETTTLKAIAMKNGDKSNVAIATYTINSDEPTPTGDYIWEETFTGAEAGTAVENVKNATATYKGDGGQFCKTYDANMAGGDQPELLIPKTSRSVNSFTATIRLGGASGDMPLSFQSNKEIEVTSATQGVTISDGTVNDMTYSYTVSVPAGTQTLTLTFATIIDQNARVDNFRLQKSSGNTPVERKDPRLSFSQTAFTVEEGSSFRPPTLNNPYHVKVLYESNDDIVALADELTGDIVIGEPGTATISAIFSGDDEYLPGEASYTITVTAKPVVKEDPQLAFGQTEFVVEEGCDFDAPVLQNPFNVDVSYSSSNEDVANVDEKTGNVTIGLPGTTTITAAFNGNDDYLAGVASYTITVTAKPVEPQDPQLAFEQTEFTVEEASDFKAPVLQNPFGVEVAYSSSNEDLAWVDVQTGDVILGDPGTVVITASFAGSDLYLPASASYTIIITEKISNGVKLPSTSINTLNTVYNLHGQHLMTPQRGVVIVNGKKLIAK